MKTIKDKCIDFFKNEDIKRNVTEIIHPIVSLIYNETYIYIWLICFYHILLIFIILANLYLLLRLIYLSKTPISIFSY
jgi:hypothetical protein